MTVNIEICLAGLGAALLALSLRTRSQTKNPGQPGSRLVWPLWTAIVVVFKSGLTQGWMSTNIQPPLHAWLWTTAFILTLASLTLILPPRAGALACWTLAAFTSALFWGDLIYYRSFGDVLAVSHFVYLIDPQNQAPELETRLQLSHLATARDLLLFADLAVALPLVFWARPECALTERQRWLAATLPLGIFLIGHALWFWQASPWSTNQMGNRLYNWTHVRKRGLLAYHAYDLAHWSKPRLRPPHPISSEAIERRLELSRRSLGPEHSHFGVAQGGNLLMMQLESFQSFLIGLEVNGQEVTPFLNKLRRESLYAEALDQTGAGSTSDAMVVMLNSLHPPSGGPFCFLFPTNRTRALPRILAEQGYSTLHVMSYDGAFWNTRVMAEHFGFARQKFSADLAPPRRGENIGWGLGDPALFERLLPLLQEQPKPFFCYVTTTMMHYPFLELREHQKLLKLPPDLEGTMAGRYLQLARFRDSALELLVARLEQADLWDSTILVLCGDHRSRLPNRELQRLEVPQAEPLRHRVPLLIRVPRGEVRQELEGQAGQLDVAPTLCQLLGLKETKMAFLGRNALAGPHASGSIYGYISNGYHALWAGDSLAESRFTRLADGAVLRPDEPLARELFQQLTEETRVTDTLLYGDRILDFAR